MKHFGIWNVEHSTWIVSGDGMIFWTTSKAVADAYLKFCNSNKTFPLEVREFLETEE